MAVYSLNGFVPQLPPPGRFWIAPGAHVLGRVTLHDEVSVWFGAVLRGDNVSILQDVTLGGTGKTGGDRHPKVRDCVLSGAGAKILGNIEIGSCARIAAGSVVLHAVPPRMTVAGVPAKIVGEAGCPEPGLTMDQLLQKVEELDG